VYAIWPRLEIVEHGFYAYGNVHKDDRETIQQVQANGGMIRLNPVETDAYSTQELAKMGMLSIWFPVKREED